MTAYWYALLAPVKLTAANNTIRITENSITEDKTVGVAGSTYYLRGDGASDDLLETLVQGIQSHSQANTYTSVLTMNIGSSTRTADVLIASLGINSYSWLAGNAADTFDATLVGFPNSTITPSVYGLSSTLSPSLIWMSPMPASEDTFSFEALGSQALMRGGQIYNFDGGGPYTRRTIGFQYVPEDRTLTFTTTLDAARTFKSFWQTNRNGSVMELHRITMTANTKENPFYPATLLGKFVFDEETKNSFAPVRMQAQALYSWSIGLREYVG